VAFREDRSLPTCRDTLLHVVMDLFLSARKADLKKGFQHLVLLVLVVVVVVGTRVKNAFRLLRGI
jgi:hypothetical protein